MINIIKEKEFEKTLMENLNKSNIRKCYFGLRNHSEIEFYAKEFAEMCMINPKNVSKYLNELVSLGFATKRISQEGKIRKCYYQFYRIIDNSIPEKDEKDEMAEFTTLTEVINVLQAQYNSKTVEFGNIKKCLDFLNSVEYVI